MSPSSTHRFFLILYRLGEAVPNASNVVKTKYIAVLATFVFRYRPIGKSIYELLDFVNSHPIDTLRADGIAPPEPKTPPKPEDVIDLSGEVDSDVEEAGADEEIQRLEVRYFPQLPKNNY